MADEHKFETVGEGEFAGWLLSPFNDNFNGLVGPYYYQPPQDATDATGVKVAFKAEKRHLNGGGSVHGGCLLTMADTSLFVFALPPLGRRQRRHPTTGCTVSGTRPRRRHHHRDR